jgi:hypothetical protein
MCARLSPVTFWQHSLFPLDASVAARIVAPRPNITAGRSEFVCTRPMVGLPQGDSPLLPKTSYTVTADLEVPQRGAEGMNLTSGGRFDGRQRRGARRRIAPSRPRDQRRG